MKNTIRVGLMGLGLLLFQYQWQAFAIETGAIIPMPPNPRSVLGLPNNKAIEKEETNTVTRFRLQLSNDSCGAPVVQEEPENERSIMQIAATQLSVPLLQALNVGVTAGRNAQGLYVESLPSTGEQPAKLQLSIRYTIPATFRWQCDVKRKQLILEVQEAFTSDEARQSIGSGLQYTKTKVVLGVGQVHWVHVLNWQPQNSTFNLVPVLPKDGLRGKASVKATIARQQGVAGVNASYFNHQLGLPLGFLMKDGELLTGPVFHRVVLGLSATGGVPKMERLSLKAVAHAASGETVMIQTVNQPRLQTGIVALYTSLWGGSAPPAGGGTVSLLIRDGKFKGMTPSGAASIGVNDWILYGPETLLAPLLALDIGSPIELLLSTQPDWSDKQHLVAGGPFLVRGGKPFIDLEAQTFKGLPPSERTSRTAVGIKADGSVVVVAMEKNASGVTLAQAAAILIQLGVQEGMNFDGGSSTQMVVNGQVVYPLTGGWVPPVTTALVFVPTKKLSEKPLLLGKKSISSPPVPTVGLFDAVDGSSSSHRHTNSLLNAIPPLPASPPPLPLF
jgi:hypothetical protein